MTEVRLDHFALKVADIEKSEEFYGKAFGFTFQYARDFGGGTVSHYIALPNSDVRIQLLNSRTGDNAGFGHLAVAVDDIDAMHAYHESCGFKPGDIYTLPFQKCYFVKDPDGYETEVLQYTE